MIRRGFISLLLGLTIAVGGASMLAAPTRAEVNLGISPGQFDIKAPSGGTGSDVVTVYNQGDEPFGVDVLIEGFPNADDAHSAVDWLSVEPASLELEPGQEADVQFTVDVPDDAETGGRYARLVFATRTPGVETEGAGVGLVGRIAVNLLMTIEGDDDLVYSTELERFAPVLEADGRVGFRTLLSNTGNIHVETTGGVELETGSGESYGRLEFQPSGAFIPGSERQLVTQGTIPLEEGEEYAASVSVDYGQDEPLEDEVEFVMGAEVTLGTPTVCENLDRGPTLTLPATVAGGVGVAPVVQFSIVSSTQTPLGNVSPAEAVVFWPDDTGEASADFSDRLVSGDYTLIAQMQYGAEEPVSTEVAFSIAGTGPNVAPLCDAA
jgi:hypothetical protein